MFFELDFFREVKKAKLLSELQEENMGPQDMLRAHQPFPLYLVSAVPATSTAHAH